MKSKLFSLVILSTLLISQTHQVFAVSDVAFGFKWTQGTPVITPELMGVPDDGQDRSGVDQTVFTDASGNLRLIFAGPKSATHSAISQDGGSTWKEDKSFRWATFSIDSRSGSYVAVSPAPEGGFRAYVSFGEKGIASAYSKDGQVWTADSGVRLKPSDFGLQKLTSSNPIKLSDGRYRMYIGDDSDYFHTCASDQTISTNIYSAISSDQLSWTPEAGIRIGSSVTKLCKLHPQAFIDNDGKYGVVYSVTSTPGPDSPKGYMTACYESKSSDGLNFNSGGLVPVGLKGRTAISSVSLNCTDPSIYIMPDKTARFFYALFGPLPQGDQIVMSVGTPAGSSGSGGNGSSGASPTPTPQASTSATPSSTTEASPTPKPSASVSATVTPKPSTKPSVTSTTITCVKGKTTKKVTGVNPKCPTGYSKK